MKIISMFFESMNKNELEKNNMLYQLRILLVKMNLLWLHLNSKSINSRKF